MDDATPSRTGKDMMMGDSEPASPRPDRRAWRRYAPLAVLLALALVIYAGGWHRYISLEAVAAHRNELRAFVDAHFAAGLAIYALVYVLAVAVSVPGGALLTITGGFLFGWLATSTTTVVAATIGATIVFLIARSALGHTLARRAGPRLQRLAEGFREDALSYLLFLRLVPVFPFWLVNLAPALLGVPLPVYVAGTFIGIIPGTVAFAVLGAGLDSIIAAQQSAYEDCVAAQGADECRYSLDAGALLTPQMVAALVALGIVALIPVALRKLRARRAGSRGT